MNTTKIYSEKAHEASKLDYLIKVAREDAIQQKRITPEQLKYYLDGLERAKNHIAKRQNGRATAEELQREINEISGHDPEFMLTVAKYATTEKLISRAFQSAQTAINAKPSTERFKTFIKKAFEKGQIADLSEIMDDFIISYTHTMHPTIGETPFADGFLKTLIDTLEGDGKVEGRELAAKDEIDKFLKNVALGREITPITKVTVEHEAKIEAENLKQIAEEIDLVVGYWNAAVQQSAAEIKSSTRNFDENAFRKKLEITPQRRKQIEERAWGKGGADADGRPRSISLLLMRAVMESVLEDKYKGPKLDLRQNGVKIHTPLISALIQKAWNDSRKDADGFADICDIFNNWAEKNLPGNKIRASNSIYSQLPEANRAELLRWLITDTIIENGKTKKVNITPLISTKLVQAVNDFNAIFHQEFTQFVKDYGLRSDISFDELTKINADINKSGFKIDNIEPKDRFEKNVKLWDVLSAIMQNRGFDLDASGSYMPAAKTSPIGGYLKNTHKLSGSGEIIALNEGERKELMETVKRLIVTNTLIDKFGPSVADRYQIANFSNPANFYELLLLFKQTGIVKIEDGLVVEKPKLGIQPLIETYEDMLAAPEMFRKMLKDPLVLSYYKQRGIAEFMVGFSDGAKSAGNFASEWQIYKCTRELAEVFAEHGIKTRFFEGRGRGGNRGGTLDNPIIGRQLMPYEVTKTGIYDATIQSDLPREAAIDRAFGIRYFANALLGTLGSALRGRSKTPEQLAKIKALEAPINFIEERSMKYFQQDVRNNPQTADFLEGMFINPDIASRNPKRVNTDRSKIYEDTRAIPVEQKQVFADLPFHYVGLKRAIEDFINNRDFGSPQKNTQTLQKLAKSHPFFKNFMKRVHAGMEHYHSDIATVYGEIIDSAAHKENKKSEASKFVGKVVSHLDGLDEWAVKITAKKPVKGKHTAKIAKETVAKTPDEPLDLFAHMMVAAGGKLNNEVEPDPTNPNRKPPISAQIVRVLTVILASDNNHPQMAASISAGL